MSKKRVGLVLSLLVGMGIVLVGVDYVFGTFQGALVPNPVCSMPTTWVEKIELEIPDEQRSAENTNLCQWYSVTFHDIPADVDREYLKPVLVTLARQDCRVVASQKVDVMFINGKGKEISARVAFTDHMAHGRAAMGLWKVRSASWVKFADGTSYP